MFEVLKSYSFIGTILNFRLVAFLPGVHIRHQPASAATLHGHFTTGGSDDKMLSTLPPVLSPNIVPRS